jgi:type II secretory pathway component PulK
MPRRGVALVLVLWLIVILGGIGATVLASTRTSSSLAANARASVVSRYAAESGLEVRMNDIERTLAGFSDTLARAAYLNALEGWQGDSIHLGDGRVVVTISDPSTRLDVNAAPVTNLATLLSHFTDTERADRTARAIRAWIERDRAIAVDERVQSTQGSFRFVTPLRSLDELRSIPGADAEALQRAAPWLTIDGDGTVNRRMASDTVLSAAFGEMRDEPSRLLIVARGWYRGHPLTHEIQAVYAVSGTTLVLVHWREREL